MQYSRLFNLEVTTVSPFAVMNVQSIFNRGLHWQSLRIRERLGYIAEELKSYDLVGLQEVGVCVCVF